jgi:putative thiamine transport system permease protein
LLRIAPPLTLALLLLPVGAGLIGTLLPAFDIVPAFGESRPSLEPWRDLVLTPGFGRSVQLTLTAGLGATIVSLLLAAGFCALTFDHPWFRRCEQALTPLLAMPHVAVAIGFAFLIAPSGWIVRLLSPEVTGWERPPDLAILRDPYGVSLMLGLVVKEVPYLVLMMTGATGQVAARPMMMAARSMGYAGPTAWAKVVLPQIYRQIRLPLYAVLAFTLSVVEVGLILAPGNPPPLPVLAARWFSSYDLDLYRPAAAASTLQLILVVLAIGGWHVGELGVRRIGNAWIEAGERRGVAAPLLSGAGWAALLAGLTCAVSILALAVWSFAWEWRFPADLPQAWTWSNWSRVDGLATSFATTLLIGLGASTVAILLALAWLENEQRHRLGPGAWTLWLLYLPLLVPQVAFLFGVQVLLVRLGLDTTYGAVIWVHVLFVLPYVFLSLADPYRALDPRYAQVGAGLGASPWRTFAAVKLTLLLRPIMVAFAVGFSVSVGQFLPTLFAGGGRIATLTTEAVTLASGADRRLLGVTAFLQAVLPLLGYALALAIPALAFRLRRGLLR